MGFGRCGGSRFIPEMWSFCVAWRAATVWQQCEQQHWHCLGNGGMLRWRDAALAGFFAERYRAEDSYVAQAEAVRALGKLGTGRDLLRETAGMKSPNDVVGTAAREALGLVR